MHFQQTWGCLYYDKNRTTLVASSKKCEASEMQAGYYPMTEINEMGCMFIVKCSLPFC